MLFELNNELVVSAVLLSHPIFVELGVQSSKLVRLVLAVVLTQVADQSRCHVVVLGAGADGGEHIGTRTLHQIPGEAPHWEDNHTEESEPKSQPLLAALNPHGVEMHVEFWSEVAVQDSVDVLQVVSAGVLVQWIRLWVRSMPAATATTGSHS